MRNPDFCKWLLEHAEEVLAAFQRMTKRAPVTRMCSKKICREFVKILAEGKKPKGAVWKKRKEHIYGCLRCLAWVDEIWNNRLSCDST
jgi:hypothetical protein